MLTPKHLVMLQRTADRYRLKLYPADDASHVMVCDESECFNFDGVKFTAQDGTQVVGKLPTKALRQFVIGAKSGMWLENNATPTLEGLLKGLSGKLKK